MQSLLSIVGVHIEWVVRNCFKIGSRELFSYLGELCSQIVICIPFFYLSIQIAEFLIGITYHCSI